MTSNDKKKIIDYIFTDGMLNVDIFLEKISKISIQAIGLNNTLKGYVFNIKKVLKVSPKKYIFFVYSKIPGKLFFFLSDSEYDEINKCKEDLTQYIKLFPFFGFRKSHCITNI